MTPVTRTRCRSSGFVALINVVQKLLGHFHVADIDAALRCMNSSCDIGEHGSTAVHLAMPQTITEGVGKLETLLRV